MKQKMVNDIKHGMYDSDEARWMGKNRNTHTKKSTNKAERKNVKLQLENYDEDDFDEFDEFDNDYDHY